MAEPDQKDLYQFLAEKPEMAMGYPPGLVEEILSATEGKTPALLEIAGRDSIAAALAAAEKEDAHILVPTIAYTGTEFGDWEAVLGNVGALGSLLEEKNVLLTAPVILGSPHWWWALATRFAGRLGSVFGFCTFCLACHMYLHTVRIPLALELGAKVIVAGERESHGGKIKVNQVRPALEAYQNICSEFGLELRFPLQGIEGEEELSAILGEGWREGEHQLQCVMRANYRGVEGEVLFSEEQVIQYLNDYLVPSARAVVEGYLADPSGVAYESIVAGFLPQPV